jgi:flagellar hook-length control protein FliK
MNLSALNKLPPNGLAPAPTEALPSANALARLSSNGMSGADFASFLHSQVKALSSHERQGLAADHGKLPQRDKDKPSQSTPNDNKPVRTRSEPQPSRSETQSSTTDRSTPQKNTAVDTESETSAADKQAQAQTEKATDAANELAVGPTLNDAVNAQAKAMRAIDSERMDKATQNTDAATADIAEHEAATDDLPLPTDLSANPGALTTIALSDNLQIITATQTAPNEKSLADFALSMGLEPGQVNALFGQHSATPTTSKSGLSTQDMLALNTSAMQEPLDSGVLNGSNAMTNFNQPLTLPTTPVSSADFQALQPLNPSPDNTQDADLLSKMNNMQLQVGSATAPTTVAPPPPSTLAVLSMMDAQLRSEDIESLKNQFDDFQSSALPGTLEVTPGSAAATPLWRTGANTDAKPAAPAFVNNPDMAQTYENLSQKLSAELAGRMHEKLNAGEWKMKFALKPASLGLVDVQLEMRDGKLTAQFHSDTAFTQDLIQNGSQKLKDALADLGLNNTSVTVNQGQSQGTSQSNQGSQQGQTGLPANRRENREKLTDDPGPKIAKESGTRRNTRSQFDSYA